MRVRSVADTVRGRVSDLLMDHEKTQSDLAAVLRISNGALSRFMSGKTDTITNDNIVGIANFFGVSADYLLGLTEISFRKNVDVAELGLSTEAARVLMSSKVNMDVLNLMLENKRFGNLTHMLVRYFDDDLSAGIAARNEQYKMLRMMTLQTNAPGAVDVSRDIEAMHEPENQSDESALQMRFLSLIRELKEAAGEKKNEEAKSVTHEVMDRFRNEIKLGNVMSDNNSPIQDPSQMIVSAIMGAYDSAGYLSVETRNELQNVLMKVMMETMQSAAKKGQQ